MKNGLVIVDAGPIFSLAVIDKLELLNQLFDEVKISKAVWEEITLDKTTEFYKRIDLFFKAKVVNIKGSNELTFVMDYGESKSVILYKEHNADFLLIDDKKASSIVENFNIKCVGTLGILSIAKSKGIIKELRPIFKTFLENNRYYAVNILNCLLEKFSENKIEHNSK